MYHGERGDGSVVLVWEDGEGDAFHGCAVPQGAMGRVHRRTSRKRRSTAFAVRTGLRPSGMGYRKRAGRSLRRHSTAFG